jgi:hypothetical protein
MRRSEIERKIGQLGAFGRKGVKKASSAISQGKSTLSKLDTIGDSKEGRALRTLLAAGDVLTDNRANLSGRTDKVLRGVSTANQFADDITGAANRARDKMYRGNMQGGNPLAALAGAFGLAHLVTRIVESRRMRGKGIGDNFTQLANEALALGKKEGIQGLPSKLTPSDIKDVYNAVKDMTVKGIAKQGAQAFDNNRGSLLNLADKYGLGKAAASASDIFDTNRRMIGAGPKEYYDLVKKLGFRVVDSNRGMIDKYANQYGVGKYVDTGYSAARNMFGGSLPRLPAHNGPSYMRSVASLY